MRTPRLKFLPIVLLAVFLSAGIFIALPALAQGVDFEAFAEAAGFSTTASITVIIARLIRTAITLVGVVTVAFMVYGGFVWMTAGGNDVRVKTAKKILTNAIIGLLLVFASFAIVSFVLRALVGDTGGKITISLADGADYPDAGGGSVFSLSSVNTECAEALQNLQLQFVFSKNVDADTVEEGIVIVDASDTSVAGTFSTSSRTVTFTPSAACESPYETEFCFAASSSYTIEVNSSVVKSSAGSSLSCTTTYPCDFSFTTGASVDVDDPTVKMDSPENGEGLYVGSIELLQAITSDDSGVSTVDFYVIDDDEAIYSAGLEYSSVRALAGSNVENAFFTDTTEEWNTSGYTPNEEYDIWARGYDCAGNTDTADRVSIVLRAANCNNGVQDEDLGEEEVDCGGDSTSAYYCGACDGDACTEDFECASGQCVDGSCVTTPKIEGVSPGDGAPGNLVTISGEGFGDSVGVVTFLGSESGDEAEVSAYTCNDEVQWSDEEVIVQAPSGAVDGPISIETAETKSDRTDDDYGPLIADFDVNAIARPGICELEPDTEDSGSPIEVHGLSFGDSPGSSAFYFTNYEASSYFSWSDELLEVVVPNVDSGAYRTQVFTGDYVCISVDGTSTGSLCSDDSDCDVSAGESCATAWCSETLEYCEDDDECAEGSCESIRVGSNTVTFTVEDVSSAENPVISYIDSGWKACTDDNTHCGKDSDCNAGATCEDALNWGPRGQYITIYGTGFGTAIGSVYFENESLGYTALGDTQFPDACGEDFWHDTSITVKVPEAYQNTQAIERVTHALSIERQDGRSSDSTPFVVLDDVPGPAICDLDPSAGPVGTQVSIFGENFGASDGAVTFYSEQSASFGLWGNDEISNVVVPDRTETGPVSVEEATNGYSSNSISFEVGDCRENEDMCLEGESCCSNGACSTSCETTEVVAAHYAFVVTTGLTPNTPQVLVECSSDGVSPTPWEGWSDPEDVCVTASVQAEFNMTMNQSTMNTQTVVVEKCVEESEGTCVTWEALSPSALKTDETGFSWDPSSSGFDADTLHRVTLSGGEIQAHESEGGGYLEEDYEWEFTTAASDAPCEVGEVNVRPSEYTATQQTDVTNPDETDVDYSAQLIAQNDQCVAVSCSGYTLSWDSDNDSAALIPESEPGEGECANSVWAIDETPAGSPAGITATVTDAATTPSDTGYLAINFLDPEIEDYFPQCSTACVNARPWGQFNTDMDRGAINQSSVKLYECEDSLCEPSEISEVDFVDSIAYSDTERRFYIKFQRRITMVADQWYRVVVDGDAVLSETGVALSESGSNYGTDENRYFERDFSWVFKTKDDEVSCGVDVVTIDPEVANMSYVGERQEFTAVATGAPDDCSSSGQTLQSEWYEWEAWSALDTPNAVGADSGSSMAQEDIVAYMILGGAIELTSDIPEYCTASCVRAGASVTTNEGVCGNGELEDSEECDDGGVDDGDGCSFVCLNEGSEAYGSTCGDGIRDYAESEGGEDCDDANTTNGDGCSSSCLNEGARSVGSSCGDARQDWSSTTGGEDCDDGNSTSGDGCSSNCLKEGSLRETDVYAICGNGDIEDGEDCDPGDPDAEGDGCSSQCLSEGTSACPTSDSGNCCGNSSTETGEECDGEEGCSGSCLWAGSSYAYDSPSFCGDGRTGTGEECDALASASFAVGDYGVAQVATGAPVEVNEETGYAVSTVSVTVDGDEPGDATLQLACSCTTDASCGQTGLGCGANNCCYERPELVEGGVYPADNMEDFEADGEGYCRNSAVWVEFTKTMDESTFEENLYLDLVSVDSNGDGVQETVDESSDCPSGYLVEQESGSSSSGFWNWLKSFVLRLFGRDARASTTFACHVPVTYEVSQNEDGTAHVVLRYSQLLEENAIYALIVVGDADASDTEKKGVLSQDDVTLCLGDDCSDVRFRQTFAIGDDVCDLDRVTIEDEGNVNAAEYESASVEYFSETGEEHAFIATPQTYRSGSGYEEISPLDGVYEWEWTWGSSLSDAEEGDVVAAVAEIPEDATRSYTASGFSGRENVLSTTTITIDELFDTSTVGETVSGALEVTALVCENPWPALDSSLGFPYIEETLPSNFSFFYCRDAEESGGDDDLASLGDPIEVSSLESSDIIQELIFQVEDSNDAIGVRVVPNTGYLSPSAWFEEQEFTGSFSTTELDGYAAVSAGTTFYAAAANVNDGSMYPNIYIVSYNEDAGDEAKEIFAQILENWRFNANIDEVTNVNLCADESGDYVTDTNGDFLNCDWDGDCFEACADGGCSEADPEAIVCDAEKSKLTRDMRRLTDTTDIVSTINSFGEANGHCLVTKNQSCEEDNDCPGAEECVAGFPTVQSGTFVPAFSTSLWGSWSAALGNELGTALPTDPVNEFYDCSLEGYDEATCWNGETGTFVCPENSHLYGYQGIGGEDYVLYAQLEYSGNNIWTEDIDTDATDEVTITVEYPTGNAPSGTLTTGFSSSPVFCDGTTWGDSTVCGDGTQGSVEACEIGDTQTIDCDSASGLITSACLDCTGYQSEEQAEAAGAVCAPYECGNGVVEDLEECDDGSLNGTYGHCSDACTVSGSFYCGDGYLSGTEACDCGTTSTYATVIADSASWATIGSDGTGTTKSPWCDVSNGQYTSDIYASCSYNCTQPGLSCGDGRINGTEECDGDYEEWEGALCSDGETTCTSDNDCESGQTCGDSGYEASGTGKICIGGFNAGSVCDNALDCLLGSCSSNTYDLFRYRTCSSSCDWSGWDGPVGGDQICGNGSVEGDEACDDGNTSDNDECLNTCALNVCGDDKVYVGVESCDDGEANGTECEASYGGTCSYCDVTCQYKSKSGGYCGDGEVTGSEVCDGAYATQLTYFDEDTGDTSGPCDIYGDSITDDDGNVYTCHWLGVCNGGTENGSYCTLDYYEADDLSSGTLRFISRIGDSNTCDDGECVAPVCANDCGSSCPTSYEVTGLLVQSELLGATPSDSIQLYSYLNAEGESPDNAALYIPACSIATTITADIDDEDVSPPDVDIVFVTDLSGSMSWDPEGNSGASVGFRRIDYVVEAAQNAIEELFDAYDGTGATMRIGLVSFSTALTDGVSVDVGLSEDSAENSLLTILDGYLTTVSLGGGTSTFNGVEQAVSLLSSSTGDVKLIVLLSDGNPSHNQLHYTSDETDECEPSTGSLYELNDYPTTQDWSGAEACVAEVVENLVDVDGDGEPRSDIIFYSAAVTTSSELIGYMAHMSSNECAWESLSDASDCAGGYAYSAESAEEIEVMYEAIVDSVLGTNVTFTATDTQGNTYTTTGEVQVGSDVELPFPDGFVCQSTEQTIPLRNIFYGSGAMIFSDFEFKYCPYE